jgi:hypothetical protein
MSEYVDLYQLKRAQAETGLTPEAKETMIIVLFDGETREDDDISLNRFMKRNGLKSEAVNLLMQDCNDRVIREDLVDRVRGMRSGIGNAVVLRRMIKMSNAVAASTRQKTAVALLIDPEAVEKKDEKKAKGKANQETKAAKNQAKREKNALAKAKRSGKPKAKGNKKKK